MLGRPSVLRRVSLLAGCAALAAACTPIFLGGTSLETQSAGSTSVRLIWNTAQDQQFPNVGHSIASYEVRVNGALIATQPFNIASCRLNGLASNTTYNVEISALSTSGEDSRDIPSIGILSESYTTPAGSNPGGTITCATEADTDGDRLPDWAETNTGTYVSKRNTGTNPNVADTDGDGLDDGEEVVGTINGLPLNQMGASPVRATIFMEVDWMDDSQECGAHTHRPSTAAVNRFIAAYDNAPTPNPDGSTGIDMIVDYGQGGAYFNEGQLVDDTIPPIGSITGGVNDTHFNDIKAANFLPVREGYFHYSLHLHRYGNSSNNSSGQAELPGDDLIVSLQCFDSTNNTSNTMMHELGHNLGLRHGGFEDENHKPNYNSVMNYRFQFPGADSNCDAVGNQVLDYSGGTNVTLNENAVNEAIGVCGSPAIDWNNNAITDPPYVLNLNPEISPPAPIVLEVLEDHDDWSNLSYNSVNDNDGARVSPPEIISEEPVPLEFQN